MFSIKTHLLQRAMQQLGLVAFLFLSSLSSGAMAAGLLPPTNSNLPELDIQSHKVNVILEDGFATTSVEQIFKNPHNQDLEALYSFPIPDKAAVGEFIFWVDGKPVVGEVLEKKQARDIYDKEKQAGRQTALTEQKGYKTFEISVTPVRAGKEVKIKLVYVQKTDMDSGIGRYVYPLEDGGVDEEQLAFWNNNSTVKNHFSFDLQIKSSWPVKGIRVPNQPKAQVNQQTDQVWTVTMGSQTSTEAAQRQGEEETDVKLEQAISQVSSSNSAYTLDKDMVVYWRLADNLPGAVEMITYKPEANARGTFMMTLTPGIDLQPINEGKDWVFILDISGSMKGKYQTLAEGVKRALKQMSPNDRVKVILFNNKASELTSGYTLASNSNISQLIQEVEAIKPQGGTNVYDGLSMAIKKLDSDRTSAIVLVTDGVANVGVTEQKQFIKLIKSKDVRLFTFVMGNSANKPLLENLTEASNGFSVNVSNNDDIVGRIMLATSKVSFEAMHDVDVKISGIKVTNVQPEAPGSLYRGEQLVLLGHYWGENDKEAKVTFSSKISGERKNYSSQFKFPAISTEHPEIERLWAFNTITTYQNQIDNFGGNNNESEDKKQAIVDIAKEYGLVTQHTSMIVLEEAQFKQYNIQRANNARIKTENQARSIRAKQAPQSRQVDQQQPMYKSNRSYVGGGGHGGALNFWSVLMLLPLLIFFRAEKNSSKSKV
ncbi:MAG: VIT and VWA domain-containing protein [Gammaproteobacteria bacterium]|nr:VIT and VWA domain-containing protein [Gammaproteobacteria bacterium]